MRRALFLLFVLCGSVHGAPGFDHDHGLWSRVLKKYRTERGWVRYQALRLDVKADADHPFTRYVAALSAVPRAEYDAWPRENRMAFLINAYNALTVKLIIDNYPVAGIKKTVGFFRSPWRKEFFSLLGGAIRSLDPIEHEWLRPQFKDARVHAAINCASISCPVLRHEAFVGKRLEVQLADAFAKFLSDPARNRYDATTGVLHLSKIFDWFEEDFEASYGSVRRCLETLGPPEAKKALAKKGDIRHLDYDWNLNDADAAAEVVTRSGE